MWKCSTVLHDRVDILYFLSVGKMRIGLLQKKFCKQAKILEFQTQLQDKTSLTDYNFSAKASTKILLAPYLTINTFVDNFNRQRHTNTKYSDYQWTNPYSAFPTGLVFVTEPSSKVGWALSVYYYRK